MKLRLLIATSVLAFGLTACVSTPHPVFSAEQGAATVRIATSTGATLALNKNPSYVPVAVALSAGIDAAISQNATLTPEIIATYVKLVCRKNNLPPADTAVFINLANAVYQTYVSTYKTTVVSATDPTVLLYVNAFKGGLNDAVAAVASASTG